MAQFIAVPVGTRSIFALPHHKYPGSSICGTPRNQRLVTNETNFLAFGKKIAVGKSPRLHKVLQPIEIPDKGFQTKWANHGIGSLFLNNLS
jgi:hypothetical protein